MLAVDLGTSGPKVGLVSTTGQVVDWSFEPVPLLLLPEGGAEQNPDDWWGGLVAAARRITTRQLVPREDIVAVAVTGQWSGTVPVRESRHLGNAIIWMDSRGAPDAAALIRGTVSVEGYSLAKARRWIRLTGGGPSRSGKDPVAHILFLKRHRPDLYQAATTFLEPKDYLNLRLTGIAAAGHDSIALHWVTDNRDLRRVRYNEGLIRLSGIAPGKLPPLRSPDDVLGPLLPEVAGELGLAPGIPVVMGTPDLQSAAVGSGAVRDYEGHLYLGTSSWIACHVPFKKTNILRAIGSLPSALPDRYLVIDEQESAGACLTYLADNLGLRGAPDADDVYEGFDRVATHAPAGSRGVIFTPWLNGERTPVEDPHVRAAFFNQSLDATREDLIRAVFEGVAFNSRWLLGCVEAFTKRPLDDLRAVGGGAKSSVWCEIHADVLDRTIHQVKDPILAGLRGVAFLAALKLGYVRREEIPNLVEIAATHRPNPDHRAVYDRLYREFLNLYRANRGIYSRLNR